MQIKCAEKVGEDESKLIKAKGSKLWSWSKLKEPRVTASHGVLPTLSVVAAVSKGLWTKGWQSVSSRWVCEVDASFDCSPLALLPLTRERVALRAAWAQLPSPVDCHGFEANLVNKQGGQNYRHQLCHSPTRPFSMLPGEEEGPCPACTYTFRLLQFIHRPRLDNKTSSGHFQSKAQNHF